MRLSLARSTNDQVVTVNHAKQGKKDRRRPPGKTLHKACAKAVSSWRAPKGRSHYLLGIDTWIKSMGYSAASFQLFWPTGRIFKLR
jgi:hypothetical protein